VGRMCCLRQKLAAARRWPTCSPSSRAYALAMRACGRCAPMPQRAPSLTTRTVSTRVRAGMLALAPLVHSSRASFSLACATSSSVSRVITRRVCVCRWFKHSALVLCPNADLCDQVAAVAAALRDEDGAPIARAAVVSSRSPPGHAPVDIIVSTPAALTRLLFDAEGGMYGRGWSAAAIAQRVRHFVADEADALVASDSYWQPLCKVLDVCPCAAACTGAQGTIPPPGCCCFVCLCPARGHTSYCSSVLMATRLSIFEQARRKQCHLRDAPYQLYQRCCSCCVPRTALFLVLPSWRWQASPRLSSTNLSAVCAWVPTVRGLQAWWRQDGAILMG
jgi:hypothetical protein